MPLDESLSQWQYRGCLAGAYNRAGNCKALVAFDSQGSLVAAEGRRATDSHEVPGGLTVVTARFLLENIHPPALLLLSYFTAPYYRAGSSYCSIFVMPDSFVAMKGRDLRRLSVLRLIDALVIMVPSILLAIALAILVARDAQRVGFAKDTRMLWVLITIVFGLPAYITYRLTRPQATLVTCANCGKHRRPDLERCHHCNSPWSVPELDPPTWRVLDAGHTKTGGAPPTAKEVPVD
jgi:hypothetical protein